MRRTPSAAVTPLAAVLAGAALALAGCVHGPAQPGVTRTVAQPPAPVVRAPLPVSDPATLAALQAILAAPWRPAEHRARDGDRHPLETLQYFGIRADQTVMEVWAAPEGWYTEILAPLLRERGHYIAANWDPRSELAVVSATTAAFEARLTARPDLYDHVTVSALMAPAALTPAPPGSVDLVLSFRNLHLWMAKDTALPMLRALYAALKPGGVLGLVDNRADPAAEPDPRARLGYVSERLAVELAESAGFELVDRAEINANPRDTRDYDQGVWSLPPTFRQGEKDRERLAAIGESDRFTLRFVKPVNAPGAP